MKLGSSKAIYQSPGTKHNIKVGANFEGKSPFHLDNTDTDEARKHTDTNYTTGTLQKNIVVKNTLLPVRLRNGAQWGR